MENNFVPQVRKSETVYKGKRINVRCDWVDYDLADLLLKEVVEHPGAVVILATDEEKNIVFVKQYRHAIGKYLFECPAGTREVGEDLLFTAKRELTEEANFEAKSWSSLGKLYPMPGLSDEVQELYHATELIPKNGETDPGEYIEIYKFSFVKVKEMILNFEITDAKTIACVYRANLLGILE